MTLDIVGIREIAQRLGVKPQTGAAWKFRGLLPPQEWTVSGLPAWRWETIERWAHQTGRLGRTPRGKPLVVRINFLTKPSPGWSEHFELLGASTDGSAEALVERLKAADKSHRKP